MTVDNEHADLVKNLVKKGKDIVDEMTPEKANLIHMSMGVAGEAGELLDAIKKHVMYGKKLDRDNAIEEIGDILFYIEGVCQAIDTTKEYCMLSNIKKLNKRYASGTFSNQAAKQRADKS